MRSLSLMRHIWRRSYHHAKSHTDQGKYEIVKPFEITPIRKVPDHIVKPCYYKTGCVTTPVPDEIEIKTEEEINRLRDSCQIASTILKSVGDKIKVGVTTDDLDAFVHNECIKFNSYPSPLYYKGFPKSICTSVNNVVCHGIPDLRPLVEGDIITVDITVFYKGFHGDCSKTFVVGDKDLLDPQAKDLINGIEECMEKALLVCCNGAPFLEIGFMVEEFAFKNCCRVIPCVTGHGIGRYFHGPPDIYHMKNRFQGIMTKGMVFTVEPAITIGEEHVEMLGDGWTVATCDNARCAQMEHTVLITDNDTCEVLTK